MEVNQETGFGVKCDFQPLNQRKKSSEDGKTEFVIQWDEHQYRSTERKKQHLNNQVWLKNNVQIDSMCLDESSCLIKYSGWHTNANVLIFHLAL